MKKYDILNQVLEVYNMKNEKYEYVQRIKSSQVGNDYVQIMMPHSHKSGISIITFEGMIYHYKPNSNYFINKYSSDKRVPQIPYSKIANYLKLINLKKSDYIKRIMDFNKVYITVSDGIVKEDYAIKDGNEALVATRYIIPQEEKTVIMTREETENLIKKANGGVFSLRDGSVYLNPLLYTEEQILEWYKERLIEKREHENRYNDGDGISNELNEYFYKSIDKLTIDDIPENIDLMEDIILIEKENNKIKSIKGVIVTFVESNKYKVTLYDFPLKDFTNDYIFNLENTSLVKTKEPRISKLINRNLESTEIRKVKRLILEKKESN